jgi:CBS domain-containing membrane protein
MTPKPEPSDAPQRRFRLFAPILAGATLRDRLIACTGALIGIAVTGILCGAALGGDPHLPLLVAPMGASAVLLFAVPASPLAQPWSIIGGNTLSALTGYLVAQCIADPVVAAGAAVALAIAVMSFTRCLHPPGGAAALTAALGGPVVASWGLMFAFVPVGLNSCILVALGLLFHRLSRRHSYPHIPAPPSVNTHGTRDLPPPLRVGFRHEDVDAALAKLHETFDIDRDDLEQILQEVELQAITRAHADLTCADIMSRDVITIGADATPEEAHALLLRHNIRSLPVVGGDGHLLGTVGLRELAAPGPNVMALLSLARTAAPDAPAVTLLPDLTDGRTHAVIVTDADKSVLGVISQTDLLSALGRTLFTNRAA